MTKISRFQKLQSLNLPIDWAVIYCAFFEKWQLLITAEEVLDYGANYLSNHPEKETPTLISLIILTPNDREEIRQILFKLMPENQQSFEIAKRKWRVLLLIELMNSLDTRKYINTVFELGDFWLMFKAYDDKLNEKESMRDLEDKFMKSLTIPKNYLLKIWRLLTGRNKRYIYYIDKILKVHQDWIEKELKFLSDK